MNREIKYLPQVILIGDIGVGKTSLVKRYVEQGFSIKEKATIGVNLSTKEVTVDDDVVTLQIWDTAGFYCLKSAFKRGVVFCMLAFDVTSYSSFEGLDWWLDEFLLRARPRDPVNFPFIVVGNKVDLGNRIVSNREVNEWCQRNNNMPYFETSAKEGTNVDLAFQALFWNALKQESNTLFKT
nr:ras-related protein rab7-like [Drosophila bipectinata]